MRRRRPSLSRVPLTPKTRPPRLVNAAASGTYRKALGPAWLGSRKSFESIVAAIIPPLAPLLTVVAPVFAALFAIVAAVIAAIVAEFAAIFAALGSAVIPVAVMVMVVVIRTARGQHQRREHQEESQEKPCLQNLHRCLDSPSTDLIQKPNPDEEAWSAEEAVARPRTILAPPGARVFQPCATAAQG